MLACAQPRTAAATELVIGCLELASDAVVDQYATPQEWAEDYPGRPGASRLPWHVSP